jgi:hypothetical protein
VYQELALQLDTGEILVLPHPANGQEGHDNSAVIKELLMFLGPYATAIRMGTWIGSTVFTVIHQDDPMPMTFDLVDEELFLHMQKLAELSKIETNLHYVCNFTKGVFLRDPAQYPRWFEEPSAHVGNTLLKMVLLDDEEDSWDGDEIAITPVAFTWMKDVTDDCKRKVDSGLG